MIIKKKLAFALSVILLLFLASCQNKQQEDPLLTEYVIGDINTIQIDGRYVQNYYAGLFMAIEEINSKGGVNGLPLRVETRSDYGNHREAYLQAEYLLKQKDAIVLTGTLFPQATLGVARFAEENSIPFLDTGTAIESIIKGSYVSDYVFRVRSGYDLHYKAIANDIISNKSIKSLVIITYSNKESMENSKEFKAFISKSRPDITYSEDIYLAPQKTVFDNVTKEITYSFTTGVVILVDGPDTYGVMKDIQIKRAAVGKSVYMAMAGEPEWSKSLLELTPENWIVTGFPWYSINTEGNKQFLSKYQRKYDKIKPTHGSYVGYITGYLIADALAKSKPMVNTKENRKKLAKALESASFNSPIGLIKMREDHQSDMGTYIGLTKHFEIKIPNSKKVKPEIRMIDSSYVDANKILPSIEQSKKIRDKKYKDNKKNQKQKRVIPAKESNV